MKRFTAMLTALCITASMLPLSSIASAEKNGAEDMSALKYENAEYLVLDDFDGSYKNGAYRSEGTSKAQLDEEHKNSLRLDEKHGDQWTGKFSSEPLEDAIYCFSFDIYMEEVQGNEQIRIIGGDAGDIRTYATSHTVLQFSYSGNDKVSMLPKRSGSWMFHPLDSQEIEARRWYNIEIWVDTVNEEIEAFVDGEKVLSTPLFEELNGKIKGFSIFHHPTAQLDSAVYVDNMNVIKFGDDDCGALAPAKIAYETNDDIYGNNFFTNKMPQFKMSYTNRLNKQSQYKVKYEAIDAKGRIAESFESEITLEPKGTAFEDIKLSEKHFGVNKLRVTLSDGENEYKKEISYTFSNRDTNEPINYRSGVSGHMDRNRGEVDVIAPLLNYAGIGNVRGEDFYWEGIETIPGVYNFTDHLDFYLDTLDKWDIDYLHLFNMGHSYYSNGISDGFNMVHDEKGYKALENYMSALMRFAKGRIKYVEVYNEYHNTTWFGQWATNPAPLVDGSKAVMRGVKAVSPEVQVIGMDEDSWGMYETGMIEKFFEYGKGQQWFDGLSIHPYVHDAGRWENKTSGEEFAKKLKGMIKEYGYSEDTPVFFTEMGWSDANVQYDGDKRAAYITATQLLSFYKDYCDIYYNYNTVDYADIPDSPSEATYGILESPYLAGTDTPYLGKEVYVAMAYYNSILANAEPYGEVKNIDSDKYFGYRFKSRNNEDVITIGLYGDDETDIGLRLNCDSVTVGDIYGNENVIYGVDGVFTLSLRKNDILYIMGNFDAAEICEPKFTINTSKLELPIKGNNVVNIQVPFKDGYEAEVDKGACLAEAIADYQENAVEILITGLEKENNGAAELYVKKDGRLYYHTLVNIEYGPSGVVSNMEVRDVAGNPCLWMVEFDLKNIRTDGEISGTVTMPDFGKSVKLPTINPLETRRIMVSVPKISNVSEIRSFNAHIDFTSGDSADINEKFDFIFAQYTSEKPVIDGVLDEWQDGPATAYLNRANQAVAITESWSGTDDLNAKANLRYDEEYVYLAVDVEDDVFCQEAQYDAMWKGDSIQIAFGFDVNSANGTQYGIGLCPDGKAYIYRNAWEGDTGGFAGEGAQALYTDGEAAVRREGNHTYYEVKLPWFNMKSGGGKVYKGKQFYCSLLVNDNDGAGRKGYMEYGGGIGSGNNIIKQFYKLKLSSR